jgi:hypothetical protein
MVAMPLGFDMYMVRPSGVIARLKVPRFVPLQETGPLMRPASRIVAVAAAVPASKVTTVLSSVWT